MYKRIFILFCFIISCSPDNYNPDRSLGVIPLSKDNLWYYESCFYDSTGVLKHTVSAYSKVISSINIDNMQWYIIENNNPELCTPNDTNINLSSGYFGYQYGKSNIVYKYPALVNEKYTVHLTMGDTILELPRIFKSQDTTITTSAGTFNCLYYYSPRANISQYLEILESDIYIDCSIGIIKKVYYMTTSSGLRYVYNEDLISSYILN